MSFQSRYMNQSASVPRTTSYTPPTPFSTSYGVQRGNMGRFPYPLRGNMSRSMDVATYGQGWSAQDTSKYAISINLIESPHSGLNQFLFEQYDFKQRVKDNKKVWSLPSLNAYLKSSEGRSLYGTKPWTRSGSNSESDAGVLDAFSFFGFQATEQPAFVSDKQHQLVTVSTCGQIIAPNIWLCQEDGHNLFETRRLWFKVKRFPYQDVEKTSSSSSDESDVSLLTEHINDSSSPATRPTRHSTEYYWQIVPWFDNSNQDPVPFPNEAVEYIKVGYTTVIEGHPPKLSSYRTLAIQSVFPLSTVDREYIECMKQLPLVTIQLFQE